MKARTRAREIALELLYERDAAGKPGVERVDSHIGARTTHQQTAAYARELLAGVTEHSQEFDGLIEKFALNWTLDRMPLVDRNILRIGACELLYHPDVPEKVAINEAVELAKKYGDADSGRFVNAILDRIYKERARAGAPEGADMQA